MRGCTAPRVGHRRHRLRLRNKRAAHRGLLIGCDSDRQRSGTAPERQELAESRQSRFQIARRKPVIQRSPERQIWTAPPTAGHGRLPEATNGCFVDAKHEKAEPERRAALGKLEGRLRVGCCRSRPSMFNDRCTLGSGPTARTWKRSTNVAALQTSHRDLFSCVDGFVLGGSLH